MSALRIAASLVLAMVAALVVAAALAKAGIWPTGDESIFYDPYYANAMAAVVFQMMAVAALDAGAAFLLGGRGAAGRRLGALGLWVALAGAVPLIVMAVRYLWMLMPGGMPRRMPDYQQVAPVDMILAYLPMLGLACLVAGWGLWLVASLRDRRRAA